ncbi:MAG: hypothetical protein IPN76_02130 [Saprospiraceae bacterium]|nr:hypothetical protein [Saprospiraceae bacterium]
MHSLFKIHLLIAVLTILAISCDKDDRDACCPKGPDSFEVGNGRVYVPNIFTPNFDGINDVFFLYGDSNIVEFKDFRITSGKTGALLFAADSFQPNNPGVGLLSIYSMENSNIFSQPSAPMALKGKYQVGPAAIYTIVAITGIWIAAIAGSLPNTMAMVAGAPLVRHTKIPVNKIFNIKTLHHLFRFQFLVSHYR